MNQNHREAIQEKRQFLIEELLKSGVFKVKNKHLYQGSLSELEEEYKDLVRCLSPLSRQ
ncbi:Fur-regulated basic protein FbpA [Neobacillus sp. LXY-1]|uniref:Fur-regulated basic protein FbpA n=1 Tax=Neobacillus sp. LXY-1 TaxID=3379133 RepID=UPI003EE240BA